METLVSLLDKAVEEYGNRPAVKSQITGENWTYTQLKEQSLRVAYALRKQGVQPGEMVARVSDNTPSALAAGLGVHRIGAIDVPIDQALRPEDLYREYFQLVQPKVVLVEGQYGEKVAQYTKSPIILIDQALTEQPREINVYVSPDDISTIIFSSGTTASSERAFKAVMLSHGNIASNVLATEHLSSRVEKIDRYDQGVYLTGVGKHWHSFEYMIQQAFLHSGCLLHFTDLPRFRRGKAAEINPNYILMIPRMANWIKRGIERGIKKPKGTKEERTRLFNVFNWFIENSCQFLYDKINHNKVSLSRAMLHQLGDLIFYRAIRKNLRQKFGENNPYPIGGSASLPLETQLFFSIIGWPINQGYGLTETSPVVSVNTPEEYRFGSSGKPIQGVSVMIVGSEALEDERLKEVSPGEEGTILISGPNVFKGYLGDKQQTSSSFVGNWFNTGDLGKKDKKGFIYITGREKDLICIQSGEKFLATPVESYYSSKGLDLVLVGNEQIRPGALIIADDEMKKRVSTEGLDNVISDISVQLTNCEEKFNVKLSRGISNIGIITDFNEHPELITSTLKLRRHLFERTYYPQIEKVCSGKRN